MPSFISSTSQQALLTCKESILASITAMAISESEKRVMVVGINDSEHSTYALDWTLKQFFTPFASNPLFRLVIVQAKPSPPSVSKTWYLQLQICNICIYTNIGRVHTRLHAWNGHTCYTPTCLYLKCMC